MTAPTRPPGARARCAVHPSRPAVDTCPVCGRPRCGADAAAPGPGCAACTPPAGNGSRSPSAPPTDLERLVRATLASYGVALLGGPVGSEYVGATVFEYLGPFVVGVICGGAATRAAGTDGPDRIGTAVRGLAALMALLGVGLSFMLEGSRHVLSYSPGVLVPYAAAVAGAVLWTIPPRAGRGPRQGLSTDA